MKAHDISLDFIVTPERVIDCEMKFTRPDGIYWEYLDQEKIDEIPILQKMQSS